MFSRAEAASISDYNSDVVSGLLQVEGYARAIFEAAYQGRIAS